MSFCPLSSYARPELGNWRLRMYVHCRNRANSGRIGEEVTNPFTVMLPAREPQRAFGILRHSSAGKPPQHSARDVPSRKFQGSAAWWESAAGAMLGLSAWEWPRVPARFAQASHQQPGLLPEGTRE